MTESTKPADVAAWMAEQVTGGRELEQADAVWEIEKRFGSEFVCENDNGNPAIVRRVLDAFTKLTKDTVVWDFYGRYWRERQEGDDPGRMQR